MRVMWLAVGLLVFSGCLGSEPKPAAEPQEPVPEEEEPERQFSQSQGGPGGQGPTAATADGESEPESELVLSNCNGASVLFHFDYDVADAAVPAPFTPVITGNYDYAKVAIGAVTHRSCQMELAGQNLGSVGLGLALTEVWLPESFSQERPLGLYAMGIYTDSTELAQWLQERGIPATVAPFVDASVWTVGYTGIIDTSIGSDRIVGESVEVLLVGMQDSVREIFHRDGSTITRWSFLEDSDSGDLAETVVLLDQELWGAPATVNLYFSSFAFDEGLVDHRFAHFDPNGNMIPWGPSDG